MPLSLCGVNGIGSIIFFKLSQGRHLIATSVPSYLSMMTDRKIMNSKDPFKIHLPFQQNWKPKTVSIVNGALEKILAFDALNQVYHTAKSQFQNESFNESMLHSHQVTYQVPDSDMERIPKNGRLIAVANHPFGGIEGLILASLLGRVRNDIQLSANFLLECMPEMRELSIFVDPISNSTPKSKTSHLAPLKESISHLDQEGLLALFPAGEVSSIQIKKGKIEDSPWSPSIASIARKTLSPVLPIYFEGSNSLLFHLAGLCHSRLRTALLPHEFMNKKGHTIHIRIGKPIPADRIAEFKNDQELTDYLRERTYFLAHGSTAASKKFQIPLQIHTRQKNEIIDPIDSEFLQSEIDLLPEKNLLLNSGEFQVFFARSKRIPLLLQEIGRLREVTFREAGEGTGKAIDLDTFDLYYQHLWVWNKTKKELVGAYRIGQTDKILPFLGKKGLYTASLFNYRKKLLQELNPGLEMGRSFVRKEYQRQFQPLLLLWKGIAQYVSKKPRYRYLFGPVSISHDYQAHSRDLIVQFLQQNNLDPTLAKEVKGRNPVNFLKQFAQKWKRQEYKSLEEIDERVEELETELKGIPVLLKQYLRLGGRILAFSEDKSFNNVIDGLILVDLTKGDSKVFGKYMGKEEYQAYLKFHKG